MQVFMNNGMPRLCVHYRAFEDNRFPTSEEVKAASVAIGQVFDKGRHGLLVAGSSGGFVIALKLAEGADITIDKVKALIRVERSLQDGTFVKKVPLLKTLAETPAIGGFPRVH